MTKSYILLARSLWAVIIILILCTGKTVWNYYNDKSYKPYGDWIANAIGFGLWILFVNNGC